LWSCRVTRLSGYGVLESVGYGLWGVGYVLGVKTAGGGVVLIFVAGVFAGIFLVLF
jgi:hypothetical protein